LSESSSILFVRRPGIGVGKAHRTVGRGVRAVENGFSSRSPSCASRRRWSACAATLTFRLPPAPPEVQYVARVIKDGVGFGAMSREEASLSYRLGIYRYGPRLNPHHEQEGHPRLA
jgi:hypothetical protein